MLLGKKLAFIHAKISNKIQKSLEICQGNSLAFSPIEIIQNFFEIKVRVNIFSQNPCHL